MRYVIGDNIQFRGAAQFAWEIGRVQNWMLPKVHKISWTSLLINKGISGPDSPFYFVHKCCDMSSAVLSLDIPTTDSWTIKAVKGSKEFTAGSLHPLTIKPDIQVQNYWFDQ